jgi:hypothetical protein
MIFTGIKIFNWLKENKQNQDVTDYISDSISIDENIDGADKYNVDFDSLKQTNSDTIAWLKVNGTYLFTMIKEKFLLHLIIFLV